jgi:hypothetical protein
MKKVIKLTESDLVRLVKKVINEQATARAGFGRREVTLPNSNATTVTIPMLIALTKQASRTNNGFINVLNRISDREMLLSFLSELTKKTGKSFEGYINQAFTEASGPEALAIHRLLKSKFNVDSNPGVKGTDYMRDRQRVFQKNFKITNSNGSTVDSRPNQAPVNKTTKDLSCIDKSLFSTKTTSGKFAHIFDIPNSIPGGVVERIVLNSDGTGTIIARGIHNEGNWSCGSGGTEFRTNKDPKSVRYLGKVGDTPKSGKLNPVKNKSIDSTKGTDTADKSPLDRSEYTDLPTADKMTMNRPELSVIPTNAVKLGIQKKLEQKMSGEQLFNLFVQNKLMDNFTDSGGYQNRRIVYKGDPLSKENVTLLTDYLVSKGYGRRFSEVDDKRYGKKYVWVRS